MMTNSTGDIENTKRVALVLAEKISEHTSRKGVVVALIGELGAGKTTLILELLKVMGVTKKVLSPTFVIQKRFKAPKATGFKNIYHIDAYRVEKEDLLGLGWREFLADRNIILVEWGDRIKPLLPRHTIWVELSHVNKQNERRIIINRR